VTWPPHGNDEHGRRSADGADELNHDGYQGDIATAPTDTAQEVARAVAQSRHHGQKDAHHFCTRLPGHVLGKTEPSPGGNDLEQQRDEFIDFVQRAVRDMPYALDTTGRWATEGFGTRTELVSALA
jgi:hypothetical protein